MNMFSLQLAQLRQSIERPAPSHTDERRQHRQLNIAERRSLILQAIQSGGPASIQELIADTGLTESSVSHHATKMEKEDILRRVNGRPVRFDIKEKK